MSVSGNTNGIRSTNNGTQSREIQHDNTNQLNPPVASHYERISLSNDDPNVRYTRYHVNESADNNQQNGTTIELPVAEANTQNIKLEEEQSDVSTQNKSKETEVPASYDKISFSKPLSIKMSTYHTIEGTLPRDTKPV